MVSAAGQKGALRLFMPVREYSIGLHLLTLFHHHSCEWISESLVLINFFQVPSLRDLLLYVQVYVCAGVCWEFVLSE